MNKNWVIRLVSFILAFSLCLLGVTIKNYNEKNNITEKLNYVYMQSFDNLVNCVDEINSAITKIQYASSATQISALTQHISNQSKIAENELKILPESSELNTVFSFLQEVQEVSKEISALNSTDDKGEISTFVSELNSLSKGFKGSFDDYVSKSGLQSTNENDLFEDKQYEYLLDKIKPNQLPKAIENKENITFNKGLMIVTELVKGIEIKDYYEIKNSEMPLLIFSSEEITFALTHQGGFPVFMCKRKSISENNIRSGQAIEFADNFLKKAGLVNMVCVHTAEEENSFKLYYAFLEGATICYTDLIVLNVAKDDGDIIYLDAFEYVYNHKQRTLPTSSYTAEDAKASINSNLTVISSASVLLPKGSATEIRCYEFLCMSSDNKKILLYLNAETLVEEALVLVEE